jgi:hypothetical protein
MDATEAQKETPRMRGVSFDTAVAGLFFYLT